MFEEYVAAFPITFLLGFYIATIVRRWWDQFMHVVWPDTLMSYIAVLIVKPEKEARLARFRIAR